MAKRGTLAFAPGESEKTVEVPLHDDRVEDDGSNVLREVHVHSRRATAT